MFDVENLLVKVSWYYFIENMTQQQISELLNIPRMRVVKLLGQARSEGIVQFKLKQSIEDIMGIELSLKKKYSLNDAVVIPEIKPENIKSSISKAAALYIDEKANLNDFLNIGFGDTVSQTVSELIYNTDKNITFVSLTGGVSYYTSSIIKGAHYRSSSKTTPNIYIIPAPLLGSTAEAAQIYLHEPTIKEIFSMNRLANLSLIGIGAMNKDASIFKSNIASQNDFQILKLKGAVGDLLSYFFDINGNLIESDFHDRLISTSMISLKSFQNTIAVAGGEEKHVAIRAALNCGYIDVLITDEKTARFLIDE